MNTRTLSQHNLSRLNAGACGTSALASSDIDFSPFFRSMIGIDRMARLLEAQSQNQAASYPPYNIEKTGDESYKLTMAVAGFTLDELDISVEDQTLLVKGQKAQNEQTEGTTYLHRGIATRAFEQRFQLADHVEVREAQLDHGMLSISLERNVPERLKPRRVEIKQSLLDKARTLIQ